MGKFSISECLCIEMFKNEEQQFDLTWSRNSANLYCPFLPHFSSQYMKMFRQYLTASNERKEGYLVIQDESQQNSPLHCSTTAGHCLLTVLPGKDQQISSSSGCSFCVCNTPSTATLVLLIVEIAHFLSQQILDGISGTGAGGWEEDNTGIVWGNPSCWISEVCWKQSRYENPFKGNAVSNIKWSLPSSWCFL